jgi:hypothetical protein
LLQLQPRYHPRPVLRARAGQCSPRESQERAILNVALRRVDLMLHPTVPDRSRADAGFRAPDLEEPTVQETRIPSLCICA